MLDDVPDLVPGELALERGHVVDLGAQLDGVTIPHFVEQHALGVERDPKFVGEIRRVIRVRAVAPSFRTMAPGTVLEKEHLAFPGRVSR